MKRLKKLANKLLDVCFYLCVAAIVYAAIQIFCFTSFRIPTDSMLPKLIPGDNILVNKLTGGARIFNLFAALEKKEVTIHRMPKLGSFKRNDILVFNFPYPTRWDSIGFDVMKYYVKRCIALPGDTLEIKNGYFHLFGIKKVPGNTEMQLYISTLPDTLRVGVEMNAYPWDKKNGVDN